MKNIMIGYVTMGGLLGFVTTLSLGTYCNTSYKLTSLIFFFLSVLLQPCFVAVMLSELWEGFDDDDDDEELEPVEPEPTETRYPNYSNN